MLHLHGLLVAVLLVLQIQGAELAPTGTLRAAFIGDNPVQGSVDPATGAISGPAPDLARELARRLGVPYELIPAPNVGAVLERVRTGEADIGFLAYSDARAELVDFSDPYLLSTSAYLVRADADIRSSDDVDRAGVRIGTVKGQSQQIYISAHIRHAEVEILPEALAPAAVAALLVDGRLDAFGANRQRMEEAARASPGLRVLADSFMVTAQAIAVEKGHASRLEQVNRFVTDVLASGFVRVSLDRARIAGVEPAPPR